MDMIGRRAIVTGAAAVIGSGLAAPSVRAQAPLKLKLGNDPVLCSSRHHAKGAPAQHRP